MKKLFFCCLCLGAVSLSAAQGAATEPVNESTQNKTEETLVAADYCPYFGVWEYSQDSMCDLDRWYAEEVDSVSQVVAEEAPVEAATAEEAAAEEVAAEEVAAEEVAAEEVAAEEVAAEEVAAEEVAAEEVAAEEVAAEEVAAEEVAAEEVAAEEVAAEEVAAEEVAAEEVAAEEVAAEEVAAEEVAAEEVAAEEVAAEEVAAEEVAADYWYDGLTGEYYEYDFASTMDAESVAKASSDEAPELAEDVIQAAREAADEVESSVLIGTESEQAQTVLSAYGQANYDFEDYYWDFDYQAYQTVDQPAEEPVAEPVLTQTDWDSQLEDYCDAELIQALDVSMAAELAAPQPPAAEPAQDWDAELEAFFQAELAAASKAAWRQAIETMQAPPQVVEAAEPPQPPALVQEQPTQRAADSEAILALASTLDQLSGLLKGMSQQLNAMAAPRVAEVSSDGETAQR